MKSISLEYGYPYLYLKKEMSSAKKILVHLQFIFLQIFGITTFFRGHNRHIYDKTYWLTRYFFTKKKW